jgi:hypothetical protein
LSDDRFQYVFLYSYLITGKVYCQEDLGFGDVFAGKSTCTEENYGLCACRYDVGNGFLMVVKIKKREEGYYEKKGTEILYLFGYGDKLLHCKYSICK